MLFAESARFPEFCAAAFAAAGRWCRATVGGWRSSEPGVNSLAVGPFCPFFARVIAMHATQREFHVALSGDFHQPDGSLMYQDIGLDVLGVQQGIRLRPLAEQQAERD